jgi:predicted nucleic acid-binding Zn ribbon protein
VDDVPPNRSCPACDRPLDRGGVCSEPCRREVVRERDRNVRRIRRLRRTGATGAVTDLVDRNALLTSALLAGLAEPAAPTTAARKPRGPRTVLATTTGRLRRMVRPDR